MIKNILILPFTVIFLISCTTFYIKSSKNQREPSSIELHSLRAKKKNRSIFNLALKIQDEALADEEEEDDDPRLAQCATDICGPAKSHRGYMQLHFDQSNEFMLKNEQEFLESVNSKVNKIISLEREIFLLENIAIKKITTDEIIFQPKFKVFVGLMKYMKTLVKLNYMSFESNGQLTDPALDKSKIFKLQSLNRHLSQNTDLLKNSGLSVSEQDWFIKLLSNNYLANGLLEVHERQKLNFIDLLNKKKPLAKRDAILAITKEITEKMERFKSELNFGITIFPPSFLKLADIVNNPGKAIYDKNEILEVYQMAAMLDLYFGRDKSQDSLVSSYPINDKQLAQAYLGSSNYKHKHKYLTNDSDYSELLAVVKAYTDDSIRLPFNTLNSELRVKRFDQLMSEVKNEIRQMIAFKDKKLQNKFDKRFAKLQLNYNSRSKADVKKKLNDNLDLYLTVLNGKMKNAKEDPAVLYNEVLYDMITINEEERFLVEGSTGVESVDEEVLIHDVMYDFIEDFELVVFSSFDTAFSDHIYDLNGNANLSWSSVRFPSFGLMVAIHEIGHHVQQILTSPDFITTGVNKNGHLDTKYAEGIPLIKRMSCIKQWHKNVKSNKFGQFSAEDWADYFSSQVIKRLKKRHGWIKNGECAMLYSDNGAGYYDLAVSATDDDYSTHSPSLFRVIHSELELKGRLPNSCQKLVDEKKLFSCEIKY